MSKVSIVKSGSRKNNIKNSLEMISYEIDRAIEEKESKTLFIKIDCIDDRFQELCTNENTLDTVIEFFNDKFKRIVVGENSEGFDIKECYPEIKKKFPNVVFTDLTISEPMAMPVEHIDGEKEIEISVVPQKVFTISLSHPKTHYAFPFAGCMANMLGTVIRNQGYAFGASGKDRIKIKNAALANNMAQNNLLKILKFNKPDLSIMDCYTAIEGTGPYFGKKRHARIALASTDAVSIDRISSRIFGFDYVPYIMLAGRAGIGEANTDNIHLTHKGFVSWKEIYMPLKKHYMFRHQILKEVSNEHSIDIRQWLNMFRLKMKAPPVQKDEIELQKEEA